MGTMNSTHRTLTCTLPDGGVATRTTARTYSHVIACYDGVDWGALAWAGRLDLAMNQRSRWEYIVQRNPEARLAIIAIETGEVVWEHEGHIRATQPEPVAPVAKPEPAPVPSAPREPKPSKAFKTPSDIRSYIGLALQPSLIELWGQRGAIQRVAEALVEDGVTERRVHNALGGEDALLAVEVTTAMSMIATNTPA